MTTGVTKEIAYWQHGTADSLEFAEVLINELGRCGQGLYFTHLAIEKTFKAHVCKETNEIAPRLHDLFALAKLGKIDLTQEQSNFCETMNFYYREGLYLGLEYPEPSPQQARDYLAQANEMISSLIIPLA